jgi:hypothetical protein
MSIDPDHEETAGLGRARDSGMRRGARPDLDGEGRAAA